MNKLTRYRRTDGYLFQWAGYTTVDVFNPDGTHKESFSVEYNTPLNVVLGKCDKWTNVDYLSDWNSLFTA